MRVRPLRRDDVPRWMEMRAELWPGAELEEDPALTVFVAEDGDALIGFVEMSLRSYAEGCSSSPVPYIEGWWVADEWRRRGVGGALMKAAEDSARERGFTEIASDTNDWNRLSQDAHKALGWEEVETVVVFRKVL